MLSLALCTHRLYSISIGQLSTGKVTIIALITVVIARIQRNEFSRLLEEAQSIYVVLNELYFKVIKVCPQKW